MLGLKLGLDTEIAVYKALLDGEEKRVARLIDFDPNILSLKFVLEKITSKMRTLFLTARKVTQRVARRETEYLRKSRKRSKTSLIDEDTNFCKLMINFALFVILVL